MTTHVQDQTLRALVVDDDAIVCQMVSFALQQEGFTCDCAADGEQALERLAEATYDLLITDLRMPRMHGYALAINVLACDQGPTVMVHTSVDEAKLTKDMMLRGVDDVVYKPTNYAAFAAKAKGKVIRRRAAQLEAPAPTPSNQQVHKDERHAEPGAPISSQRVRQALFETAKTLAVSRAAVEVSNMVSSASFDAEQVTAAIARDRKTVDRIVRLANRSFYNPTGTPVTTIKQAVTRIGQKRVGELALAMSAFSSVKENAPPWMDLDLMLRRSLAAGIAVERLIDQGSHTSISEGLLFSALMHSLGRVVLGTHYPERYQAMIQRCAATQQPLVNQEDLEFPENHAEVMCQLLDQWNVPAEYYAPLNHVLNDYESLASLQDPIRTKVELVKLAIVMGDMAVGHWEPWDLIELPPNHTLDRLGDFSIDSMIAETESDLPGIDYFQPGKRHQRSEPDSLSGDTRYDLPYRNLSEMRFDFLPPLVRSMGLTIVPADLSDANPRPNMLVNRIGSVATKEAAERFADKNCERIVFVRDADKSENFSRIGSMVAVPCSYASLRQACYTAAGEAQL